MKIAEKLAQTIMRRYPRAEDYPYKNWSYPQGFMLWGMEAMYRYTGEEQYRDYILAYCEAQVRPDGSLVRFTGESMDDMLSACLLPWAHAQTGDARYAKACRTVAAAYADYPRNPDGGFWHAKNLPGEMWVDGVFMGQMFWSKYVGTEPGAPQDYSETVRQLATIFQRCRKGDSGLLLHAYSADGRPAWSDPETGCSPEVWSEGLGWYALMLPQALEVMPPRAEGREALEGQYRLLLQSLRQHQHGPTGLWCQVVDKENEADNWQDASGSAMFLYALQKGIELGVVTEAEFGPVVQKAYQGLHAKLAEGEDGLLDVMDACEGLCVQNEYQAYVQYPKKVNAQEAVAAVLWAAALVEKPGRGQA